MLKCSSITGTAHLVTFPGMSLSLLGWRVYVSKVYGFLWSCGNSLPHIYG